MTKKNSEPLIPPHGGYAKLVTYKLGNLIYDATTAFCDRYINIKDRTHDQMVQAARSGVINIMEGSEASATSKKSELKLTNVAKASQEELLGDYMAFLRQRNLPIGSADSVEAKTVRNTRPGTLAQLRQLMGNMVSDKSDKTLLKQEVAANTMICLINQETYLLGRQITKLAMNFKENGGFTERLYRVRSENRKKDEV